MADEAPSFEVRERRRFKETADTDIGSGKSEDEGKSGAPPEAAGSRKAAPEKNAPSATNMEAGSANDQASSQVQEQLGSGERDAPGHQSPNTELSSDTQPVSDAELDTGSGMPDISVFGVLQFTVGTLSQLAWQGMGLIANSATGKLEPRMTEARMAVDALRALIPVMSPSLDESSKRELQTLLSNLQLNYVEQVKRREI